MREWEITWRLALEWIKYLIDYGLIRKWKLIKNSIRGWAGDWSGLTLYSSHESGGVSVNPVAF